MSDEAPLNPVHIYSGERCIYCGVNTYDAMLYGPEHCIDFPERKSVWTFEEGRNDMEEFEDELEAESWRQWRGLEL